MLEEDDDQRALLYDYIMGMGCGALIALPREVYSITVRLFYNKLIMKLDEDEPIIRSYVLGTEIKIDRTYLKCLLELNDGDLRAYFSTDEELRQVRESLDITSGLQQIVSASCHTRAIPGKLTKNDLKPEHHILHLWLRHNVILAKGHYDIVTPFELYLYYLQEGVVLDLPTIILNEMVKINQTNNRALGYGDLLTQIFRNYGVDLSVEASIPTSMPIKKYTIERTHILEMLAERAGEDGPVAITHAPDIASASISDPHSSASSAQLEEIYRILGEIRETQRIILERLPPPPSQP